jgi:stress response protein YsnF
MPQQTIIAHFDSRSDAEKAMNALTEAGIDRSSVRLIPEAAGTYQRSSGTTSYDHQRDEGGFFGSLGDLFLPDEDRYAYAEGMSRGGVTLAVTVEEARAARVAEIVERYGAVDMDEREKTWRNEGWTGYGASDTDRAAATADAARATGRASGDEVIPIVEEDVRIGKRVVNEGRVRIRSYIVETPVQEQVSLREETVRVERRPVDRPVSGADEALFRERTIEAEERGEEAVVSKEARVKEELVVRKDVEEHTETVSDTARRTEVDIEDKRGVRSSGTTGSTDRNR